MGQRRFQKSCRPGSQSRLRDYLYFSCFPAGLSLRLVDPYPLEYLCLFRGCDKGCFTELITVGIAAGLMFGKLTGVLWMVAFLVKLDLSGLPAQASWCQMTGFALLCGIGFTMSLFIGLLAFIDPIFRTI